MVCQVSPGDTAALPSSVFSSETDWPGPRHVPGGILLYATRRERGRLRTSSGTRWLAGNMLVITLFVPNRLSLSSSATGPPLWGRGQYLASKTGSHDTLASLGSKISIEPEASAVLNAIRKSGDHVGGSGRAGNLHDRLGMRYIGWSR